MRPRLSRSFLVAALAGSLAFAPAARLAAQPVAPPDGRIAPSSGPASAEAVVGRNGMVVAQEAAAARVGAAILARGGNAIDAAVAVGFALAVTVPRAGNLGGGGFMVIHRADGTDAAIDFRESAPAATTPDLFLDTNGKADPERSRNSALAIGIPGSVAGLALAHERFGAGRLALADLIEPAVRLAREGIPVQGDLFDTLTLAAPRLARWPATARTFLQPHGSAPGLGDRLRQPDLAASLEMIARDGPGAFYDGPIADRIVAAVSAAGGIMTRADLAAYRAELREPVQGTYRGYAIRSMPLPSSGGIALVELLNILEGYDLASLGAGSPIALHLAIEAMKLVYPDRAEFLGDAERADVTAAGLVSKPYAAALRAQIDLGRARPAAEIRPDSAALGEGDNTTHVSVVDRAGNAVAFTTSLNFNYGVGLVADGTGILLNNTLDDFAAKPGAPNAFGLIGGSANAPGPGKRPLSSMTPTIVLENGKPVLITGAPGGARIISTVLQIILARLDFGLPLAAAVAAPRVHHQWRPDEVLIERALPPTTVDALATMGHKIRIGPPSGSAHSIAVTPDGLIGAADQRVPDALAVGE